LGRAGGEKRRVEGWRGRFVFKNRKNLLFRRIYVLPTRETAGAGVAVEGRHLMMSGRSGADGPAVPAGGRL
jgi:hypothetical protein